MRRGAAATPGYQDDCLLTRAGGLLVLRGAAIVVGGGEVELLCSVAAAEGESRNRNWFTGQK
jgi:hypothetical protein